MSFSPGDFTGELRSHFGARAAVAVWFADQKGCRSRVAAQETLSTAAFPLLSPEGGGLMLALSIHSPHQQQGGWLQREELQDVHQVSRAGRLPTLMAKGWGCNWGHFCLLGKGRFSGGPE